MTPHSCKRKIGISLEQEVAQYQGGEGEIDKRGRKEEIQLQQGESHTSEGGINFLPRGNITTSRTNSSDAPIGMYFDQFIVLGCSQTFLPVLHPMYNLNMRPKIQKRQFDRQNIAGGVSCPMSLFG